MLTPTVNFDLTSGILSPLITFTRSLNTATTTGSNGLIAAVSADAPRFDYHPVTLVCKGLLIEETRQNRLLQSEAFDVSPWATGGGGNASVTANNATSPDGQQTADLISDNSTTATPGRLQSVSHTSGTTLVTGSVYTKAGTSSIVSIRLSIGGGTAVAAEIVADLSSGQAQWRSAASGTAFSISAAGNGWYRITVTVADNNSGNTFVSLEVRPAFATTYQNTLQVTATGDALFWGAQIETGALATSYIPTTTAAVTRNADVATITGTNFSDFWRASKGGVLVRARPGTVSGTRPWVQFDDNTADNIIALRGNTTNPELYIVDGGTPQAQIDAGTIAANTDYSMTAWWQTNDCKARLNNGAVVTDTTATIPTVTQARLGNDGTNYLNGHLASISYYDTFSGQIYTRRKNKAVFSLL